MIGLVKMVSMRYYTEEMTQTRLHHIIERVANLLRNEDRFQGHAFGLQPIHLQVLNYLSLCNRYSDTPAAVTDYIGQTKGTVSQSLLVLEEKGFIQKYVDQEDRRVVHLSLSRAGENVIRKTNPPTLLTRAIKHLTASERETLDESLMQLLQGLQRAGDSRSFGVCRTCRFFEQKGKTFRCGLTLEPLREPETRKICREHQEVAVRT